MVLGDVAVKPPAKVNTSLALLPKVKLPVLLNTVAACVPLMLVLEPNNTKLYPLAVVVSVGVVRLSAKVMVRPATVLLNTTLVSAFTAAAKVAP